jgi:hypothetical protein
VIKRARPHVRARLKLNATPGKSSDVYCFAGRLDGSCGNIQRQSRPGGGPTDSGFGLGIASGTAPGQMGTCVCPGDGCQESASAISLPTVTITQRAKIKAFISYPYSFGFLSSTANRHRTQILR